MRPTKHPGALGPAEKWVPMMLRSTGTHVPQLSLGLKVDEILTPSKVGHEASGGGQGIALVKSLPKW